MRYHGFSAALLGAAVLLTSGCGGIPGPHVRAHPAGWKEQAAKGANPVWFNPQRPREQYMSFRQEHFNGSLKDLASLTTTNVILRHRGSRYVNGVPLPACPGEAGLQTYTLPAGAGHPSDLLKVAFTVWNNTAITIEYERPSKASDSKSAMQAMAESVCTAPIGNKVG